MATEKEKQGGGQGPVHGGEVLVSSRYNLSENSNTRVDTSWIENIDPNSNFLLTSVRGPMNLASSPWDFNGFEDMGWVSKFLGESRVLYEDDGTIWYGHCTMNYERLVSYGGLRIFQLADSKKEGLLHSDCVNREYRGRGLHRSLIKVREKRAVDLEVSVLYASVHPKNTPCISNLEKMGFKLRSKVEKKVDKRVERTLTYFKDIG